MKKNILIMLIGLVAGTTITAGAAYVYTARDIGFNPSDENWSVNNASEAIDSLKTDISNMQNLANQGNIVYDAGTNIVGLVSDNSPYIDNNGNYILASSSLGQSMIDNVTYKSIESPKIVSGSAGSETVSPYNSNSDISLFTFVNNKASGSISIPTNSGNTFIVTLSKYSYSSTMTNISDITCTNCNATLLKEFRYKPSNDHGGYYTKSYVIKIENSEVDASIGYSELAVNSGSSSSSITVLKVD